MRRNKNADQFESVTSDEFAQILMASAEGIGPNEDRYKERARKLGIPVPGVEYVPEAKRAQDLVQKLTDGVVIDLASRRING